METGRRRRGGRRPARRSPRRRPGGRGSRRCSCFFNGAATPHVRPLRSSVVNPRGQLLRLATAGSVDDGKSTLIGRLLYDSKALMSDQLAEAEVDLANITDG